MFSTVSPLHGPVAIQLDCEHGYSLWDALADYATFTAKVM